MQIKAPVYLHHVIKHEKIGKKNIDLIHTFIHDTYDDTFIFDILTQIVAFPIFYSRSEALLP